LISVAN